MSRTEATSGRWLDALLVAASISSLLGALSRIAGAVRWIVDRSRTRERHPNTVVGLSGTSSDWWWESDAVLRFTYCSPRVADQLGFTPAELLGRATQGLVAPQDAQRANALFSDAVRSRRGWDEIDISWTHAAGHPVTLQGSGVPVLDETGNLMGFRGTRRLVAAPIAAEQALGAARDRISAVLERGAVEVALQPIVAVTTGTLAGAEALVRFPDERGPDTWFGEARRSGQSLALDRLAFTRALATVSALPVGCYLSVNASPELLTDPDLVALLAAGDLPLDRLVVEITEHVAIDSYDDILATLRPLRQRGLRIAVDDTGAGYASFNHVLQLRPDIIKIDRSLVSNLSSDPARRSLITSLVLFALDLGARLTAEGVETSAELDTLATLGVDAAQGFLLSRPTTDIADWQSWSDRTWQIGDAERTIRLVRPTEGYSALSR